MKLDTSSRHEQAINTSAPQKFSKLAIFALALAVIPCCPMLSLLGGAMGLFAFQRIRRSNGRLTGRRTAMAAAISGFVISLASSIALNGVANYIERTNSQIMQERLISVVNSAAKGDFDIARQQFATDVQSRLTEQIIAEFGKAAQDRYGRLQRFSMTSSTEHGVFNRRMDVAGVFYFDRAQQLGSASFEIRAASSHYWPQIRLIELVIEDKDSGDLRLPLPNASSASRSETSKPHSQ